MEASPVQPAGLLCESSIVLIILDNYLMPLLRCTPNFPGFGKQLTVV